MMRRTRFLTCVFLVMTMVATGFGPVATAGSSQPEHGFFDLANVPLPASMLPEAGYQVLTGGFLDHRLTSHWIASPRDGDPEETGRMLIENGWTSSYVLDLVLLEDRAYAESEILSLVQTNVYLFSDEDGAEIARDALADYSTTGDAEPMEPVIQSSTTVRLRSQSGDTYRSLFQRERTLVEIITLEAFGSADLDSHRQVTAGTYDRMGDLLSVSTPAIGSRIALIEDGERVADLFNAQQTGVHQVYRLRNSEVQAAAGEIDPPAVAQVAPGLGTLYQGSQAIDTGGGVGYASSWIGHFRTQADAAAFVDNLPDASSGAILPDPYFTSWADEQATSQGVMGLYRVTGTTERGVFSGTLEIQQQGEYVVGIGWRTFGDVLPAVDVTSRLMDAQLGCLADANPCANVPLDDLLPVESATPVVSSPDAGGQVSSPEFGWSLPIDSGTWNITEEQVSSGYDFVELVSGSSLVTLESVVNQHGDPEQCVIDELRLLQEFESHAVIELGSDDPGEAPAGLETGHGWGIYTVEPLAEERADQEYTIRIDCYTIVEGGANLVMSHRVPRYQWESERDRGQALRDVLVVP